MHARRGGTVADLAADIGTRVVAWQVLTRLDDPDRRFASRAAELARDKPQLELEARRLDAKDAEAAARRARTLSASGALSGRGAQDPAVAAARAENLAAPAEGDVAEAELAVSRSVRALDDLTVRAPIAGTVTARYARLGEAILAQVDAGGDAPLFTIIDPDRLALDVDVAETALGSVQVGQRGEAVLGVYFGMRCEEICVLKVGDIEEIDSIWIVNLRKAKIRLKTPGSPRYVPLHDTLLRMGLLDSLVTERESDVWLFPDLTPSALNGRRGEPFGKWFTPLRREFGIYRPEVVLHSFRHTIATTLHNAEAHRPYIEEIVGHESTERQNELSRYTKDTLIQNLTATIDRLDYGIDLAKLFVCEIGN